MPGHIIHLAAAKCVLDRIKKDDGFENEFLIGSIAPDAMRGNDKRRGHFWSDAMFERFARVPDVEAFYEKYRTRMKEPYVLGYYGHLYLDALFMRRYWRKHFSFYDAAMEPADIYDKVAYVKVRRSQSDTDGGKLYSREELFSERYYYGDYDRVNPYMIKKYRIVLPQTERIDGICGIDELNLADVKGRLAEMTAAAGRLCEGVNLREVTFESTQNMLTVFGLEELERLIFDCANQILKCI